MFQVLERELIPPGLPQRFAGGDPRIDPKSRNRSLIREYKQIADPSSLAGQVNPTLP